MTCVWVKNDRLASAKPIYNVSVRIEYLHDSSEEFIIQNACWWHQPTAKGKASSWPTRIDLEANESQCVPVFMQPTGATTLDPAWPQSAMDQDHATRPLRPGRWTIKITVSADSIAPIIGRIEFTVYQEQGREGLSIGCQQPMGDVWLPVEPDLPSSPQDAPQSAHKSRLSDIWRWIGTKWKWGALVGGSIALSKAGEYAVGLLLLLLSGIAAASQIFHWKKAHPSHEHAIKILGSFSVVVMLFFLTVVTFEMKGSAPWSHLQPAPNKTADRPTTPASGPSPAPNAVKPPDHPDGSPVPTESPIDALTRLGWLVIADPANGTRVQFQDRSKDLPDMRQSTHLIGLLHPPISVGIIEAQSLKGLSALGSIRAIESVTLAGNFSDLAELRSMKFIQRLDLVGMSVSDLESVGTLHQLRELTLQQRPNRALDIEPLRALVNLHKLSMVQFLIQSLAPLRGMPSLAVLSLTGSIIPDLSPVADLHALAELTIDQRMVPALSQLSGSHLKLLQVNHTDGVSDPIDLTPVTTLASLETFDITAAGVITLAPLRALSKSLIKLIVTGTTISFRDMNYTVHLQDPGVIADLHNLKFLGLAWVDISNTDFLDGLSHLEDIYINQTRTLSDIRTLGTLTSLRSVQLAATNVVDISPLLNLVNLKTLTLQVTPARFDVITELKRQGVTIK